MKELIEKINDLPDSQMYVNRDLDPLAVFDAWITTQEVKALAARYERLQKAAGDLGQKHIEVAEADVFALNFGDGTMLTGMSPKDIYQIGYAAALFGLGRELTALRAELEETK